MYVLGHLRDPLVPWDRVLPFFRACDLDRFGEPVSVDAFSTFQNRHLLTTNVETENFHNAMIVDPNIPRDPASDEPVFRVVWNYMLRSETPVLSFERQGDSAVEIYWHAGTLQESTNLVHWGDTAGAESPWGISLTNVHPRIFYRVQP